MTRLLAMAMLSFLACGCTSRSSGPPQPGKDEKGKPGPVYKEVVCFVYHRFGDSRFPSTNTSVEGFEAHLAWLARHQYQVLGLSEAIEYLHNDAPVKNTAVITIDDGYKSFYKNGLPLLIQYNFPATLFINTKTVGAGDYMDWQELRKASQQNIEIGNHTHTHDHFLNKIPEARYRDFENDTRTAQRLIEKALGLTPQVLAYPYGEFDHKMKTIVASLGFAGAAAQNSGVMNNTDDPYQIPRFPMSGHYANTFEEKASMHALKVIRKSPDENGVPPGTNRPLLRLTIDARGLLTDRLQCFSQSGDCEVRVVDNTTNRYSLTVQPTLGVAHRRRTLITLTAPDSAGNWHWFSHLWVNTLVK